MKKTALAFAAVVAAVVLVLAGFAGGFVVGHFRPETTGFERSAQLEDAVQEVRSIILDQAYEPSDDTSMTVGAIRGMLDSLGDPYAVYFDEEHYSFLDEQTRGEYYGIGITVTVRQGGLFVVSVFDETPADAAGLKAEDRIVAVDGQTRETWDLDEAVQLIRGPEGTSVTLEIERGEPAERLTLDVERARIDIPNLESELIGEVGYVRLLTFNQHSADDLADALGDLEKRGAQGFVFDLRDNPGGLLSSSIDVASLFIEDGVVVSVRDRDGAEESYRADGDPVTDKPLVVLINENSASASEIVAGALQDYERATLVGVKSFGKGSVQQIEELSFGGAVKLTTSRYFTPQGRSIDKVGLTPDVVVEMEPADQAERETDVQLQRALEIVRGEL